MLLQFSVENFRSFRDEAVLSMVVPRDAAAPERAVVTLAGGERVYRVAAIYGANASGKSNLVHAMRVAGRLVCAGTRAGARLPYAPFRLSSESAKAPTRVTWIFHAAGARWSYGLEFDSERVYGEYLTVCTDGSIEQLVFDRSSDESRAVVTFGDWWPAARRQFVGFVAEGTRANQPFLAEARERVVDELRPVLEWFASSLVFAAGEGVDDLPKLLRDHDALRESVERTMAELIDGAGRISSVLLPVPDRHMPAAVLAALSEAARDDEGDLRVKRVVPVAMPRFVSIDGAAAIETIQFEHRGEQSTALFDVSEESDGTVRLLTLAPILYLSERHEHAGSLFVIDELDRSLHSLLTWRFIDRFLDTARDARQLVFTTHDTYMLHGALIPWGCVWFTEKHPLGRTTLYSLAEFKQEQLDHFVGRLDEGYLQGRFGAIPFAARRGSSPWGSTSSAEHEGGE